jgi:bifunctional enzyme CysN/CysC
MSAKRQAQSQSVSVHRPSGATIWITGLPGAGKSSVARALSELIAMYGRPTCLLDGDEVRRGLNSDLGFDAADRSENVRRVGEVAALMARWGIFAIVALISPFRKDREIARTTHEAQGLNFVEVYLDIPLEICEMRDPKGLYALARAGELTGLTGIDSPFEPPSSPDVALAPSDGSPSEMAAVILCHLAHEL